MFGASTLSGTITKRSKAYLKKLQAVVPAPNRLGWYMIAAGALLLLITLIAAQMTRPYGSDDVANQVMLQSWTHGLPLNAVAGADTFILKLPIFLLEDVLIPHNSRLKLFILVVVFAAALYASMVVFFREYIPKQARQANRLAVVLAFLPLVWYFGLTALPSPSSTFVDISWVTNFFKINLRNAELGAAMLLMLPWAAYLSGRVRLASTRNRIIAAVLAIATGLLFFSDPYFLFTLGIGAAAATAVLWLANKLTNWMLIEAGVYALIALATYKVVGLLCLRVHYYPGGLGNFSFASFNNLPQTMFNTGEGIFKMFNADFWGLGLHGSHAKIFLVNAILAALCVVAVVIATVQLRSKFTVLRLMLISVIFTTLAVYCFSLNGTDPTQSRYLMLAVLCSLPLLADWLLMLSKRAQYRRLLYTILALTACSVLANLIVNARLVESAIVRPQDVPNAINYTIIKAAEQAGAYKGYADYWDADINTYFSDRKVVVIPITCASGTITRYTWLYNLSDYEVSAHKTFFLTTHEKPGNSNGYCGDLLGPFGTPAEVINISKSYTMYIYDRDIGPDIAYTPAQIVTQHQ